MKKIKNICICLSILILLTGCGKLDMKSYTQVNDKGNGEFSFKVIYDNSIAERIQGTILENRKGLTKEEAVRKYMNEDKNVEEYKVQFKSLSELNKKLGTPEEDVQVTIKENKSLTKTLYTYEMKFNKLLNSATLSEKLLKSETVATTSNYEKTAIDDFIKKAVFTNAVNLPGKIVSNNAVENQGNTLIWSYYLGQITPDTIMTATYEIENKTNKSILAVIGVIGAVSLIVLIIRKIMNKRISE